MDEREIRGLMVSLAASLFDRGYAAGGAGALSARLPDGCILMTPADSSLGRLATSFLSKISPDGEVLAGDEPSKDAGLHLAIYESDSCCGAIVHLHSAYLTALSGVSEKDDACSALHQAMRMEELPLLPYRMPGDPETTEAFEKMQGASHAFLLANHGAVVLERDIVDAVSRAEELEDSAKLLYFLGGGNDEAALGEETKGLRF